MVDLDSPHFFWRVSSVLANPSLCNAISWAEPGLLFNGEIKFIPIFFYRYDTFIERSCEQLNIARRQQMNVEITAKIKRLICCDGHYPSTTRRTTFNYVLDRMHHFSEWRCLVKSFGSYMEVTSTVAA